MSTAEQEIALLDDIRAEVVVPSADSVVKAHEAADRPIREGMRISDFPGPGLFMDRRDFEGEEDRIDQAATAESKAVIHDTTPWWGRGRYWPTHLWTKSAKDMHQWHWISMILLLSSTVNEHINL